MKNLLTFLLFFFVIWLTACKKEKPKPSGDYKPSIEVKDADGNPIEFRSFEAWIVSDIINVKAVTSDGRTFYVYIDPVFEVKGKHGMNGVSNWATLVSTGQSGIFFDVHDGSPEKSGFVSVDELDAAQKRFSLSVQLTLFSKDKSAKEVFNGKFANQSFSAVDPYETDEFSAKIDQRVFTPARIKIETQLNGEEFYVWALDTFANDLISLNFPAHLQEGAFEIHSFGNTRAEYSPDNESYLGIKGYLFLEYYNPKTKIIRGIFDFTAENSSFDEKAIEGGSFNVKY